MYSTSAVFSCCVGDLIIRAECQGCCFLSCYNLRELGEKGIFENLKIQGFKNKTYQLKQAQMTLYYTCSSHDIQIHTCYHWIVPD